MIRIATLIAAVALATPAAAQFVETSLLSPAPLTGENWIPRPAVVVSRVAQEVPAPAPAAAPVPAPAAAPAPAAVAAPVPSLAVISAPQERAEQRPEQSGPALKRA